MDEKLNKIAKFNFWSDKIFDLGFLRSGYTKKIADFTFLVAYEIANRKKGLQKETESGIYLK